MSTPIIFDLDGTLVDSADGILTAFAAAFAALGLQPQQALDHRLIGPPLQPTLRLLAGNDDPALLGRLTETFKANYDSEGYKRTRVYAGIEDLLASLAGRPLFIATNKRHVPTEGLMNFLGWRKYFQATASLDTLQPAAPNKAALIHHLLERFDLPAHTLYVGDRADDGLAAAAAGIPFFHATWGYEGTPAPGAQGHGDVAALRTHIRRFTAVALPQ